MTRWLLWTLAAVILGGIVHLTTILALPRAASRDAVAGISNAPGTRTMRMCALARSNSSRAACSMASTYSEL